MHKGVVLATLLVGLIAVGSAVYSVLDPMLVRTVAVTLRNPATGAQATCRASFAPGFAPARDPQIAVSSCVDECEVRGFRRTGGDAVPIIDYISAAAAARVHERYHAYVPAACRV